MYTNPVKIIETDSWISALQEKFSKFDIHRPLIVTTKGNVDRNDLSELLKGFEFFTDIENNPGFESCQRAINYIQNIDCDCVVAIGGGSTMDTAKVMVAAKETQIFDLKKLLNYKGNIESSLKKIFLPTTHGTASEVTMWGTIWNYDEKQKYSLAHPALYPDVAILDPNLSLSMDLELSISTTLDALSHSFETLWNVNTNERSINYAIEAILIILEEVPDLKANPSNIDVRKRLLKASNLAGLAFSNTKTAAAHSISYPLTFSFGIPHGIACSLPILPLIDINKDHFRDNLEQLLNTLGTDINGLKDQIADIPKGVIKFALSKWGIKADDFDDIVDRSFTKSRISNNIVDLSKEDVKNLLYEIL